MKVSVLAEESEENSPASCCPGKGRGVAAWNLDASCCCHCPYRVWKRASHRSHARAKTCGEHWCGTSPSTSPLKAPTPTAVSPQEPCREGRCPRQSWPHPAHHRLHSDLPCRSPGPCTSLVMRFLATWPFPLLPPPHAVHPHAVHVPFGKFSVTEVRPQPEALDSSVPVKGRAWCPGLRSLAGELTLTSLNFPSCVVLQPNPNHLRLLCKALKSPFLSCGSCSSLRLGYSSHTPPLPSFPKPPLLQ